MDTSTASKPITTQAFFTGLGLGATVKKVELINFALSTTHTEVVENGIPSLEKNRLLTARYSATIDYKLGFEIDFSGTFIARPINSEGRDDLKQEIEGLRDEGVITVYVNNSKTEISDNYYVDSSGEMLVVLKSMQSIAISESIKIGCEEGIVPMVDEKGNYVRGLALSLDETEESIASSWLMKEINTCDAADVAVGDPISIHTSFKTAVFNELLRMVAFAS